MGEYRESAHIDFMCAIAEGYRAVRSAASVGSLGPLFRDEPRLLRGVRADRYGIRTVLEVEGVPIRFAVVLGGRIPLRCEPVGPLPVPTLCRVDLFAEKLLANCDRWADRSTFARDALDLLIMSVHWGPIPAEALAVATGAYGLAVSTAFERATGVLREDPVYLERCFEALSVSPQARAPICEQLLARV